MNHVTAMGTTVFDDDDLLAWSRRTKHWHANERTEESQACAREARAAAEHRRAVVGRAA